MEATPTVPTPKGCKHISAPSVALNHTMLFLGPAMPALPQLNSFPSAIATDPLPYHDFSDSIVHRYLHPSKNEPLEPHIDVFTHIIYPYDTATFEFFLSKHNLLCFYLLLVTNLRNGFPPSDMPPLTKTVFSRIIFQLSSMLKLLINI
jgi:hypothetical protein